MCLTNLYNICSGGFCSFLVELAFLDDHVLKLQFTKGPFQNTALLSHIHRILMNTIMNIHTKRVKPTASYLYRLSCCKSVNVYRF